jgi:hypothetical protein
MSDDCLECGKHTQWDGELGSSVCTTCGTLSNSTQTTLASHAASYETSGHEGPFAWDLGNPTLKSIRNKDGRALSGQGKEVRLRQNMVRFLMLLIVVSQWVLMVVFIPVLDLCIHQFLMQSVVLPWADEPRADAV